MTCVSFSCTDPTTTEIYSLSLHDALPICSQNICVTLLIRAPACSIRRSAMSCAVTDDMALRRIEQAGRSEEHTSELQSHSDIVCRLLLEKKNRQREYNTKIVDIYQRTTIS